MCHPDAIWFRTLADAMLVVDMDLVMLIDDPGAALEPSHLVQMLGDLLERVRPPCLLGDMS